MSLDGAFSSSPETSVTAPLATDNSLNNSCYTPVEHHWFYRRLADGKKSRKKPAVEQGATWQPFSAFDSRRLEKRYERLQERIQNKSDGKPITEGQFVVATDGGRYDVDLVKYQRRPVYWRDDLYQIRRCSWFYKRDGYSRYEPYSESLSEQLEENYRNCIESFSWNKRFALSANELIVMQGPASIAHYDNCLADEWLSMADNPTSPRQVHRGVDGIFNFDADDDILYSTEQQIEHLIFFIHGVGGVCDIRFRSCVEVVNDFRAMANGLLATAALSKNNHQRTVPTMRSSGAGGKSEPPRRRRIEFLPISWHSCTRRDTGINDRLHQITLKSVPKLRQFLNKVIVDALLYSSGPVYCQTIIDNVGNEMNRLYGLFLSRNPGFQGSVSIAGHSLGSIIAFDLLVNQEPPLTPGAEVEISETKNNVPSDNGTSGKLSDQPLDKLFADLEIPMQYLKILEQEHINDLHTLALTTDADLKEIGLPLGIRRKLSTYINRHRLLNMSIDARRQTAHHNNDGLSSGQSVKNRRLSAESQVSRTLVNGPLVRPIPCMGQWMIRYPQLRFKPRCFFAFGSPMPMFLAVRGVHEIDADFRLPTCNRMLNIFHPYDPLAYRIEPLIDTSFSFVKPVLIPHHRGGKRIHLQLRDGIAKVGSDIKHKILGSLKSTWSNLSELTRFGSQSSVASTVQTTTTVNSESTSKSMRRMTTSDIAEETTSVTTPDTSVSSNTTQTSNVDASTHTSSSSKRSRRTISKSLSDMELVNGRRYGRKGRQVQTGGESSRSAVVDNGEVVPDLEEDEEESNEMDDEDNSQASTSVLDDETELERSASSSTTVGTLNGGRRLDYVLQEKPIEYMLNEYVFAFSSHASYWQNEDSAMMMLNEIYMVDDIQLFDYFE